MLLFNWKPRAGFQLMVPLIFLILVSISTACHPGSIASETRQAQTSDSGTSLVWVADSTQTPPVKRLMLVTAGKGYYVESNNSQCRILKGFGFDLTQLNSLPVWPLRSDKVRTAQPLNQPTLLCLSDDTQQATQVDSLHVLQTPGAAPRYFYKFSGAMQSHRFYELGCQELLGTFARNFDSEVHSILQADLDDAEAVLDLNCLRGSPFPTNVGTLAEWCSRPDLNEAELHTLEVLLSDAGVDDCAMADSALRRKHADRILKLPDQDIGSVGPFTALNWLKELDLTDNSIEDITPLEALPQLVSLRLGGNRIRNIQPLRKLLQLRVLDLEGNDIDAPSIASLSSLVHLEAINTKSNPRLLPIEAGRYRSFFEICSLRKSLDEAAEKAVNAVLDRINLKTCVAADVYLKTASDLNLSGMKLTDITPLFALASTGIQTLNLSGNPFIDARPLKGLGQMQIILDETAIDGEKCPYRDGPKSLNDFCHTRAQTFVYWCQNPQASTPATATVRALRDHYRQLTQIADGTCDIVYQYLSGLENLTVNDNRIADSKPFRGLDSIRSLSINSTSIADIDAFAYLEHLTDLALVGGSYASIDALSRTSDLKSLFMKSSQVKSLAPLARLRNLTSLTVIQCPLSSLVELRTIPSLRQIGIFEIPLESLDGLQNLVGLEDLFLSDTLITDISLLARLTNLKKLGVLGSTISSLLPLTAMHALEELILTGPRGTVAELEDLDLRPLQGALGLKLLTLSHYQIANLEPIWHLKALRTLYLNSNGITSVQHLANLSNLEELNLSDNRVNTFQPLSFLTNLTVLHAYSGGVSPGNPLTCPTRTLNKGLNAYCAGPSENI